ncbi:MAG TPA: hypothetical protein EYP40_03255 [Chromatiales bacterium]|nr:hypothetical protein [Chromatiales bacterium]
MPRTFFFILLAAVGVAGCSRQDDGKPADQAHIWQSQTDALRQAEQLRDRTNAEAQRQQQQYDLLNQERRRHY